MKASIRKRTTKKMYVIIKNDAIKFDVPHNDRRLLPRHFWNVYVVQLSKRKITFLVAVASAAAVVVVIVMRNDVVFSFSKRILLVR